jgi:MGT family glycosyltransferase
MKVVVVTWSGGGVIQPAIGLGRLLVERGHDVGILAPASLVARVQAAACRFHTWPAAVEFDPNQGRAFEDQWDHVYREMLIGPGLPAAVEALIAAESPDVVVVDYMLRSAVFAVERAGLPVVPLMHMSYRQHGSRDGDPDAEWGWRWQFAQLNGVRTGMGLAPLPVGPANPSVEIAARSRLALVVMPREFDDWPDPPPNVHHVGPIFEESNGRSPERRSWESPWPADDPRPLIVISLGSTYMHQEELLARICWALAPLHARLLLLTGTELSPEEVPDLGPGVAVRQYVPHQVVLPEAAVMITHGGMGTLMAAFAAGIPTVCVPLGRDQHVNAERAVELGTSVTLSSEAPPETIAEVVDSTLHSARMRSAAGRMRDAVHRYAEGGLAVEVLEHAVRDKAENSPTNRSSPATSS